MGRNWAGGAEETEGVVLVYKIRKDCFKIINKFKLLFPSMRSMSGIFSALLQ